MEKNYCFKGDTKVKLLQAFEKALFASKSNQRKEEKSQSRLKREKTKELLMMVLNERLNG